MAYDVIQVQNVHKYLNKKQILRGVSFYVEKGEIFGFLGPNGAGKTTTISIITGMMTPDEGDAYILWLEPRNEIAIKKIGYLPENFSPPPGLKVYEFLEYMNKLKSYDKEPWIKIPDLLRLVELDNSYNKMISTLSKGMLQRLGIAQALVGNPDILILDEPLSGLDPIGRKIIKRVMLNLTEMEKTIFFSSHILEDIEDMCMRLALIHKGIIIFTGTVEEFKLLYSGTSLEDAFFNAIKEDSYD